MLISWQRAYIEESRRIREEQDWAYAESLKIDQEKVLLRKSVIQKLTFI